jgi:hypothetical protein
MLTAPAMPSCRRRQRLRKLLAQCAHDSRLIMCAHLHTHSTLAHAERSFAQSNRTVRHSAGSYDIMLYIDYTYAKRTT